MHITRRKILVAIVITVVILVAGFTSNLGYKEIASFFPGEGWLDWDKINSHCQKFVAIHSDNDPYVPLTEVDMFREKLNAKTIVENDKGHFTSSDNITENPTVISEILKLK